MRQYTYPYKLVGPWYHGSKSDGTYAESWDVYYGSVFLFKTDIIQGKFIVDACNAYVKTSTTDEVEITKEELIIFHNELNVDHSQTYDLAINIGEWVLSKLGKKLK